MRTKLLILTLLATLALTSCASLTRPSVQRIVVCPTVATTECPDLKQLEGTGLDEFKRTANSWITDYGTCKLKHDIVVECLKAYEER